MKAIIFDMDGVIIDSEPVHFQLEREMLEELGGTITKEEYEDCVGITDYDTWYNHKQKFNLEPSVQELIDMKKQRFIESIHRIHLVENFQNFVKTIHDKGYLMGLASSNNRRAVDSVIKNFNLDKYLEFVISGEEVTNGKPDPEIFLTVAKKMNVSPKECLVIEDATSGVTAAKAAGMKCIGLNNPNSYNQDLSQADLIIDNFDELNLEIINSLFK